MKKNNPPKLFHNFFRWFCHPKLLKYIEGDLMELYEERVKRNGKFRADLRFIIDVMFLFRPAIIRPTEGYRNLNTYGMYKSYFKIGWRNLIRNKGYSLINIGGLAVGIAIVILIGLWIQDELLFNTFHKNYTRIARVMRSGKVEGKVYTTSWLPGPLADELRNKYGDDFERVAMMARTGEEIFAVAEKKLTMKGAFMEPDGLEMFSIPLQGDKSVLNDPNSIIISTSFAKAMFGEQDPIGKTITMRADRELKVTGVYEKLPHNSDFHEIDFFAPYELFVLFNPWVKGQGFANNFLQVYAEIPAQASFENVSAHVRDAIFNNIQDSKDYVAIRPEVFLHPMERWHLYGNWSENGSEEPGLMLYVKLFGIIGVFILLLACINFMNLTTARSEKRAKEVGIRKSIGSARQQLIGQFFSESFLIVAISFTMAIGIVGLALNGFNTLAAKQIIMPWSNPYFWMTCLAFIFITGFISGSYPALYLSSFNPVKILKGTFRAGRFASVPRKILVVIQFTVSVTMIIGTSVVYRQLQHARNRPVGYEREGLLMIPMLTSEHFTKYDVLKDELMRSGAVENVAVSQGQTTEVNSSNGGFTWRGMTPGFLTDFGTLCVSADYGKTVGWNFIQGRDFSDAMASDSLAIVMNESAAKLIGIENPVGEDIRWAPTWDRARTYHVIGVIEDMIMKSPFDPAMPIMYFMRNRLNNINVRMNANMDKSDALAKIESVYKSVITNSPFTYKFADQQYALKFAREERISNLATVFACLAILISCLGLFGLASFVAEQKTKEIGIRKVMGATVFSLWKRLSADFIWLVAIAALIAVPLSWYFMSDWLSAYPYRTTLSWWIFVIAISGSLILTLLTVSYQSIRASLANPVKSLRSE